MQLNLYCTLGNVGASFARSQGVVTVVGCYVCTNNNGYSQPEFVNFVVCETSRQFQILSYVHKNIENILIFAQQSATMVLPNQLNIVARAIFFADMGYLCPFLAIPF